MMYLVSSGLDASFAVRDSGKPRLTFGFALVSVEPRSPFLVKEQ